MAKDDLIPSLKRASVPERVGEPSARGAPSRGIQGGLRNYKHAMGLSWVGQWAQRGSLLAGMGLQGQQLPPPSLTYNPFTDESLDHDFVSQANIREDLAAAGSSEEASLIIAMARKNLDRRQILREGNASWAYLGAGLTDPSNLIPVPMVAGKGFWAAAKAVTPANAAIVGGTELYRHDLDPTSTPEETWMGIGAGTMFAGVVAGGIGSIGGISKRVSQVSERSYNEAFFGGQASKRPENPRYAVARPALWQDGGVRLRETEVFDNVEAAQARLDIDNARRIDDDIPPSYLIEFSADKLDDLGNVPPGQWRAMQRRAKGVDGRPAEAVDELPDGFELVVRDVGGMPESVAKLDQQIEFIEADLPEIQMRAVELKDLRDAARVKRDEARLVLSRAKLDLELARKMPPAERVDEAPAAERVKVAQKMVRERDTAWRDAVSDLEDLEGELAYTARISNEYRARRDYVAARAEAGDPSPIDWSIVPTGVHIEDWLAKSGQMPWYRMMNNGLREIAPELAVKVQEFAGRTANNPGLLLKGHLQGRALPVPAEARALSFAKYLVKSKEQVDKVFAEYAGIPEFGNVRAAAMKFTERGSDARPLGYAEFQEAVGKAVFLGSDDPHVARAADIVSREVFAPVFERMDAAGVLPTQRNVSAMQKRVQQRLRELDNQIQRGVDSGARPADLRPLEDAVIDQYRILNELDERAVEFGDRGQEWTRNYFHRMWDRQAVMNDLPRLRRILTGYYESRTSFKELGEDGVWRTIVSDNNPDAIKAKVEETLHSIMHEADLDNASAVLDTRSKLDHVEARIRKLENELVARPDDADIVKQLKVAKRKKERLFDNPDKRAWGYPSAMHGRKLDIPNKLVQDFIVTNWEDVAAHYLDRTGRRLALAESFGDADAERIILKLHNEIWFEGVSKVNDSATRELGRELMRQAGLVREDAEDLVMKVLGLYEMPKNPGSASTRMIRGVMGLGVLNSMGRTIWAQVMDAGNAVFADYSKDLIRNFTGYMLKGGEGIGSWKGMRQEIKEMGLHREVLFASRQASFTELGGRTYGVSRGEGALNKAVNGSFILNLMAPWTDMVKGFSGGMTQSRMIRESIELLDGSLPADRRSQLAAWGIDKAKARKFVDQWREYGGEVDGVAIAGTAGWSDKSAAMEFQAILNGAVENLVLTPGAASRPNFLKEPVMKMIFQYRAFGMLATQAIMMAGLQRRDARYLNAVTAMIALAWLTDYVRDDRFRKLPAAEQALRSVERSGVTGSVMDIFGALGDITNDRLSIRGLPGMEEAGMQPQDSTLSQKASPFVGAAPSKILSVIEAFTTDDATAYQQAASIRYMAPLNNLIWIEGLFDSAQQVLQGKLQERQRSQRSKPRRGNFLQVTGSDGRKQRVEPGSSFAGRVVKVSDGDTLTVVNDRGQKVSVRMAEIDAPEFGQAYGRQAQSLLERLAGGKDVEVKVRDVDQYGRAVGSVMIDGRSLNSQMAKRGMAWAYRDFGAGSEIVGSEERAREGGRGLWEQDR